LAESLLHWPSNPKVPLQAPAWEALANGMAQWMFVRVVHSEMSVSCGVLDGARLLPAFACCHCSEWRFLFVYHIVPCRLDVYGQFAA